MRNAIILLALLGWFGLVVVLALARCWYAVVPLLALGGLFENIAHNAHKE